MALKILSSSVARQVEVGNPLVSDIMLAITDWLCSSRSLMMLG